MEYVLTLNIEPLDEGGYLAINNDWPELLAQGRTIAETLEIAQDVARKLVESYLHHGDPLPAALRALTDTAQLQLAIAVPVVA